MGPSNVLIIPCYNEERRMDPALVRSLVEGDKLSVLLVNDGSTDGTGNLIQSLVEQSENRIKKLDMPRNSGKAEAVRTGLLHALAEGAARVGYADADFATPPNELLRLLECLETQALGAVLGCRVARLGAHIERRLSRHFVSRLFANLASAALGVSVYDTQCGAKWFRDNSALRAALRDPFQSRWAFDVELLARLLGRWGDGPRLEEDDVLEVPIRAWRDVGGSKVTLKGMVRSLADMFRMVHAARRAGRGHAATLETVPIELPRLHPRTSWDPGARTSVPPIALQNLSAPRTPVIVDQGGEDSNYAPAPKPLRGATSSAG